MHTRAFIRAHPFFQELSEQALDDLARLAQVVVLERGQVLGLEGAPCQAVYWVVTGALRALKMSPEGREQVVNNLGPGQVFYIVPALDGEPLPVTTEALTRSEVLALGRQDLLALVRREPSVALRMLVSFAQRLRKLSTLAGDLALRTVPQRLAALLLEQAHAAEQGRSPSRMTQREMAGQLGTVREVVARALGQFEQQGLISLSRGRISIRDAQGLADLADL